MSVTLSRPARTRPNMGNRTRRQFLSELGWCGVGGLVGLQLAACSRRRDPPAIAMPAPGELRLLSLAEYLTLAAACERILPADADPGALDLGVPRYIDAALADGDEEERTKNVRAGLARLDAAARDRFDAPLHLCKNASQDALLSEWAHATSGLQAPFFRRLLALTLEGAFCDPTYGGNRNGAGWRLIGFEADPFAPWRRNGHRNG